MMTCAHGININKKPIMQALTRSQVLKTMECLLRISKNLYQKSDCLTPSMKTSTHSSPMSNDNIPGHCSTHHGEQLRDFIHEKRLLSQYLLPPGYKCVWTWPNPTKERDRVLIECITDREQYQEHMRNRIAALGKIYSLIEYPWQETNDELTQAVQGVCSLIQTAAVHRPLFLLHALADLRHPKSKQISRIAAVRHDSFR